MFLWVLAFAQATFIPGLLGITLFRVRITSIIQRLALSLALSLLFNWMFVFALVAVGLYSRSSVFALVAVEACLSVWLAARWFMTGSRSLGALSLPRFPQASASRSAVVALSAGALAVFAYQTARAMFRLNVFDGWDPLFEWNRWAMPWYAGHAAPDSMLYPQLIPANWSMMYHIMGSPEFQSVPLSVMPVFVIAVLALFLDLAVERRRYEYLIGLLFCGVALFALRTRLSLASGHVDMAVTFMAATAFYLIELRDDRLLRDWRQLILPLLVAAGATVTKLNGFYALAVVLCIALIGHVAERKTLSRSEWLKSAAVCAGILVLVPGTWYGLKFFQILTGRETTYYGVLTGVTTSEAGGTSLAARLTHAVALLPGGWISFAVLTLLVAGSIAVRRSRWVALGVFVPYTVLWAVVLSYDLRNELMMVPVAAYLAALAVSAWVIRDSQLGTNLELWTSRRLPLRPWVAASLAGVFVLAVAAASVVVPTARLEARELALQRTVGSQPLNLLLYKTLSSSTPIRGAVLTDYAYLDQLPRFRASTIRAEHTNDIQVTYAWPTNIKPADLNGKQWLLLSTDASPDVQSLVEQRIRSGAYSVVFTQSVSLSENAYPVNTTVRLIRVGR